MTYHTLECGPGVSEALAALIPQAPPRKPWEPDLALLTGIPVIPREGYAPGSYKLTEHSACTVHYAKTDAEPSVTHENCPVVMAGTLTAAGCPDAGSCRCDGSCYYRDGTGRPGCPKNHCYAHNNGCHVGCSS